MTDRHPMYITSSFQIIIAGVATRDFSAMTEQFNKKDQIQAVKFYVTPTIFGSTVGYPSDSLASCLRTRTEPHSEILTESPSMWTLGTTK